MKFKLKILYLSIVLIGIASLSMAQVKNDLYGIWAKKAGFAAEKSGIVASRIVTDSKGNIYVSGRFYGTTSLSDNTCNPTNTKGFPYSGNYNGYWDSSNRWHDGTNEKSDGFINKYDPYGGWLWTVNVQTNVCDDISSFVLSEDEKSLTFLAAYGNASYSEISAGTASITYGTGITESLDFTTPQTTCANYVAVRINTEKGEKEFAKYLGYGTETNAYFLKEIYSNANNIYITGSCKRSNGYCFELYKVNNLGDVTTEISKVITENPQGGASFVSKNKNLPIVYHTMALSTGNICWQNYLAKTDLTSNTVSYLSYISNYCNSGTEYWQNYGKHGILTKALDVNNANTHLFLAGNTLMNFTYEAKGITINNSGGSDGIIVCYDPQNPDQSKNIRWMVNLKALGDQQINDCKFDELTQTLSVIGTIDETVVNFNPNGIMLNLKADNNKAMFYAVYNMDGICVYAKIMDSPGEDIAFSMDFCSSNSTNSTKELTVFGTFDGSPFNLDPSERLSPLRTTNKVNFIARYSTDQSTFAINPSASYSTAQNKRNTYGSATHEIQPCIKLGSINEAVDYYAAELYQPKPIDGSINYTNPNYDGLESFNVNIPSGGMSVKVKASNTKSTPAYLAAWIDFNDDGIFEESEMSEKLTIPANANNVSSTIKWTNLPVTTKAKLNTFMRVRLSSEDFNGNLSQGHLTDGEVEDYALSFDLLDFKKAVSVPDPDRKLELGDILEYTIRVKSKINTTVKLFDPIPQYTAYIEGSASDGGLKQQLITQGETLDAIVWDNKILTAGTEYTYKFNVIVNKLPTVLPANVYNVAFVTMNGDTIPSNSENCNTLPLSISSITAHPDLINSFKGDNNIIYDIIGNDSLGSCTKLSLDAFDFVSGTGPQFGSITINTDKDFEYLPSSSHKGIDSVWYYIKCSGDSSATMVYYLTHDPLARKYYACPNAVVTLGFNELNNVNYDWYTVETEGSKLTTANTMTIVKGSSDDKGTWWVEPIWKGIRFPRIQINLESSIYCGNQEPQGCSKDGTVLFNEDFRGREITDPWISPVDLIAGRSDLAFSGTTTLSGHYSLVKHTDDYWVNIGAFWPNSDYNFPKDKTRGYFMYIDPAPNQMNAILYEMDIDNLCGGTDLSFTTWATDLHRSLARPKIEMQIIDKNSGIVLVSSGVFLLERETEGYIWRQYGFDFRLPDNVTEITFKIINKEVNNIGNDWALDNIEIRFCAPLVNIKPKVQDTIVCINSHFKLEGSYTDIDGTFGNNLSYIWMKRVNGTSWTNLETGTGTSPLNVNKEFTISKADEGYYRLVVSNPSNINSENCRAISDSIFVKVREGVTATDIRIKTCPQPGTDLNLSKYLYEQDYDDKWTINWTRVQESSPEVKDINKGTVDMDFGNRRHTYRYRVANECANKSAQLYIGTANEKQLPPSRVFVCKDFAEAIHINKIFGLETGTIVVENYNAIKLHLTEPTAPSIFAGALILDGKAVWEDYTISTTNLDGHEVKIVTFVYTVNGDCWPLGTQFRLEVIITKDLL